MNVWILACVVLLAAMVGCLGVCVVCDAPQALAAVEVAGTLLTSALMLMSEGFHRQPFVDLAVTFAFMSVIGALAFARMMERDI